MRILVMSVISAWLILAQVAMADSMSGKSGVSAFSKCSMQCATENKKCRQKLEKNCKANDESCFEACTVAYPECMAKCPRPGR